MVHASGLLGAAALPLSHAINPLLSGDPGTWCIEAKEGDMRG